MRVVLLAVCLLLAGCAGSKPEAGPGPTGPSTMDLAPGCSLERVAVPHKAGGINASFVGTLPLGCLVHTGVDSSEPTIGIASDGSVFHYPAAIIDRDTPAANGVRFLTGVARSQDDGASWRILLPTAGPVTPTHQASLDPYFYLDPDTDRIFADDLQTPNCSILSFSDDLGMTWTNSLSGCSETDHQTLFGGPPVSSTMMGYPNILYRCSINLVALDGASASSTCTKSLDGGLTNQPTGQPAFVSEAPDICSGGVGHGTVGDDGTVYLPKGTCDEAMLFISKDEGMSWTGVQVAPLDMAAGEHDAGVGVDAAGNVYYFWIAEDRLPYLAVSRDGGATWGEPLMVGAPGITQAHLPALQAAGEGKVAFAYFGSFNAPGVEEEGEYTDVTWDMIVGMSVDALSEDPTFLSARTNPPEDPVAKGRCGTVRCNDAVKDFIHLEIGPDGTPWAALVDGCMQGCVGDVQIDGREGAAARLWGGPSLRDPE